MRSILDYYLFHGLSKITLKASFVQCFDNFPFRIFLWQIFATDEFEDIKHSVLRWIQKSRLNCDVSCKDIDLAGAKSESLPINSLLKQNIKSCNTKEKVKTTWMIKKGLKKYNFARTAHFFVHFSVVALPDYNVKLPEISHLHVLLRKCMYSCSPFFSLPPIFPLVHGR